MKPINKCYHCQGFVYLDNKELKCLHCGRYQTRKRVLKTFKSRYYPYRLIIWSYRIGDREEPKIDKTGKFYDLEPYMGDQERVLWED